MSVLQKAASVSNVNDARFIQEALGQPLADKIYRDVFGNIGISRERGSILDKVHAIDINIRLDTGMILTGQEKFLSYKYASFESVTVEYEQNQWTHEEGDWFKIASQFYFVGYLTEDKKSFEPWILLNWTTVAIATELGLIQWIDNKNKNGRARASFRYCKMCDFPQSCVIAIK